MPETNLTTRKMAVAPSGPATLDEQARTVDAVMTTEAPAKVVDWERWELVDEILILDGANYAKQMPLLDTHDRSGVGQVLGSVRDIRRDGDTLVGTVHFSSVPEADSALTKVREGHLTDFSIGYTVQESVWVPEGQSYALNGKSYDGPVKLSTKFEIKELSICPIGADKLAKARAAANLQPLEAVMPKDIEGRSPEATPTPAPVAPIDLDAIRKDAADEAARMVAENNKRSAELLAMGRKFDCLELAEKAIADGTTVSDFNGIVLEHVSQQRASDPVVGFRAEMGVLDADKFRAAAMEAVLIRGGQASGQSDLAGLSLRELARECLTRSGRRAPGNLSEMIARAMTSSDLPNILAAAANKSLMDGYESAPETWSDWCDVGSAPDLKQNSIVRASELDDLDEIPEAAEYKYGDRDDAKEVFQVAKFGKLFALTEEAIINDDLSAMTDIPAAHGEAAARKVGDVAYAVLTANTNMGDGKALFHADHANLSGASAAPGVSTLGAAIAAMKKQKDVAGKRRLNIRPQFFLAPVDLEGAAEQLFLSNYEGTQAKPGAVNPYFGNYFIRVYEPRLTDASPSAWYLAGAKGKTVKIFFLNGQQAPQLYTRDGWRVDGTEWKVKMRCAAKAVDWRSLYKYADS
jgi:hypothetical protein